jgi:hypothetical protein
MAAINFPSSPSNGDAHTENGATYEYATSTTSWLKVPSTWINDGAYVYYDGALNVGIGTTTPTNKLHVVGTTLLTGATDVTGDFAVNTDVLWVNTSNGRVGIGNTSPTTALDVTGTLTATSYLGDGSQLTGVVTLTDTQTLTNKTMDGVALTGKVTEDVFVVTGTSPELDPANGTMATWTLTGTSTPTFAASWTQGESMLLLVNDGTGYGITFPTTLWNGGTPPTLATSGYTIMSIFKVGANFYASHTGDFS